MTRAILIDSPAGNKLGMFRRRFRFSEETRRDRKIPAVRNGDQGLAGVFGDGKVCEVIAFVGFALANENVGGGGQLKMTLRGGQEIPVR